jgi:carboxyl-terminal processing protease
VVAIADYGKKQERFKADFNVYNEYFDADSRICVLADINTASASECLIGSMLDYGAISYGDICLSERGGVAKTYGKGIMQSSIVYRDKSSITLTVAYYNPPCGTNYHQTGITPDVSVMNEIQDGKIIDKQYETAVIELKNLINAN